MTHVMVRYQVKPDRAEENEQLVRAVYAELADAQPAGLSYATVVLDDGVSFIHLAAVDTDDGQSPLNDVAAFAGFQQELGDRVVAPPTFTTLRPIGSYRMFDAGMSDAGTSDA
jgi:hypothetical protein